MSYGLRWEDIPEDERTEAWKQYADPCPQGDDEVMWAAMNRVHVANHVVVQRAREVKKAEKTVHD